MHELVNAACGFLHHLNILAVSFLVCNDASRWRRTPSTENTFYRDGLITCIQWCRVAEREGGGRLAA
jgi:hypothetical protein